MKSKKAIILLVTVTFLLIGSAPMEALTVLCYSCVRPAGQSLCNYQGRIGTWGDDIIVDGVVFHVCNIPSIVPRAIQPGHAFTGERHAQIFLQMFTVALAGLHYPQIDDCNAAVAAYRSQFRSDVRLQNLCEAKRPTTRPDALVQIDCEPGTPDNGFNTGTVISVVVECK